jgi:acetylornithine deacetylase/succinyl-diaminopimelate desuccinylase-like protein
MCRRSFKADFAIALEPTNLKVVHAAKGVLRLLVKSRGRAAHGSSPQRGRNAIYVLTPFLATCRDVLAPMFAGCTHPVLGGASLNVGSIRGGDGINIVPAFCTIGIDMRTHPNLSNQAAIKAVRNAAAGLTIQVHCEGPSFSLPRDHAWVRGLAKVARGPTSAPWFSDANVLNAYGTPAVAFGPGSIKQAHTSNEFIELEALSQGAHCFETYLTNLEVSRGHS